MHVQRVRKGPEVPDHPVPHLPSACREAAGDKSQQQIRGAAPADVPIPAAATLTPASA